MTDLFSKFDPLIAAARGAARHRRHGPVRPGHGEGALARPVAICNGKRDDPARHLQLYGHDLRSPTSSRRASRRSTSSARARPAAASSTAPIRPQGSARRRSRTSTPWTMPWSSRPATRPISASSRPSPARTITSSSTSTATPRSTTAARSAMPRSSPSATTTSTRSRSASAACPPGAGKLVVLEGVYSMLGDIAPLKEMVAVVEGGWRDGAGRRGPFDGLHRRERPRRRRGAGRDRRRRFRHRHLLQDRSARSAASASPTIPSSRSCAWSAAPTSSPPRCRRSWSPPPRPRSAS